jgi:transketolase
MPTEPIADKWAAFNWHVIEIHGHNVAEILAALDHADEIHGRPVVIIARTTKGKGVSFMENQPGWHGGIPDEKQFQIAKAELEERMNEWTA